MPPELKLVIEGLAPRRPPPATATVHRQVAGVVRDRGWPVPGYYAVYDVVRSIDPAMAVLAHDGSKRYKEVFDLLATADTGLVDSVVRPVMRRLCDGGLLAEGTRSGRAALRYQVRCGSLWDGIPVRVHGPGLTRLHRTR